MTRPQPEIVETLGLPLVSFEERQIDEPIPYIVLPVGQWPELFPPAARHDLGAMNARIS